MDNQTDFCPKCHELVKITDMICPKCGEDIERDMMGRDNQKQGFEKVMDETIDRFYGKDGKVDKKGDESGMYEKISQKEGIEDKSIDMKAALKERDRIRPQQAETHENEAQTDKIGNKGVQGWHKVDMQVEGLKIGVENKNGDIYSDKGIDGIIERAKRNKGSRTKEMRNTMETNEGKKQLYEKSDGVRISKQSKETLLASMANATIEVIPIIKEDIVDVVNNGENSSDVDNKREDEKNKGFEGPVTKDLVAINGSDGKNLHTNIQTPADQRGSRTILKNRSPKCKICRYDFLYNDVNDLRLKDITLAPNTIAKMMNEKYPEHKININTVQSHFRYHFIVRDNFSSSLATINSDGVSLVSSLAEDDDLNELLNSTTYDLDFIKKQRKILNLKMKRLHNLYEWIDNIQMQIFSMEDGNESVNGEMNMLNIPKDFYAMSQMCEFMENSAIEALEKLDKKVIGRPIDYMRVLNFITKLADRMIEFEEEIGQDREDIIEMFGRFKEDIADWSNEIRD